MKEARDFAAECTVLADLLDSADHAVFDAETQFKRWTVNDILAHLHLWNHACVAALESREAFYEFVAFVLTRLSAGDDHRAAQRAWLDHAQGGLAGRPLFERWRDDAAALAEAFSHSDPERRIAWVGPDMTVRAKAVARQMESWAHGQAIFDLLAVERNEKDRVLNIADLGVRTYSWTFRNRGLEPPQPKPFVALTAPSGSVRQWNAPQTENAIRGTAVDFARVVTQTRNIADVDLEVVGAPATRWMAIAQCFAGGPEDPPAPGRRHRSRGRS